MDTLIPSVTTPNLTPGTDNSQVGGSLDVSGTDLGNLKPGTTLNVTIQTSLENFVNSVKLEANNQLFEIPVKLNLTANTQSLQLPESRPYPAEIRVTASQPEAVAFKFITIDGRQPESFVQILRPQELPEQQTALDNRSVINTTSNGIKTEVQLHNLSFKTVAAQVLDVKQLSPEISAKLPPLQLEIAFQQVASPEKMSLPPETRAVIQNLKIVLQQPQLAEFPLEVENAAQNLVGKPLPAITLVRPEINLTSFQTPLGEVISATPLRLDNQLPVELVIKSIITPPDLQAKISANPLAASVRLVEKLAEMPSLIKISEPPSAPQTAAPVTKLLEALKPLNLPEQTMSDIVSKMPAGDKKMLVNLVNYVKASVHQDIKQWLGPELVDRLAASGPEGREALQQLTTAFNNSTRETPAWRMVEIPFYNGESLEKIRLAVKKYNEDDEESPEQQKQKYGTRFVVDTNFTKLGRFQFDGYSLLRDKRFDLIIRTERQVSNDLCANIMRIFKNTLHEVDYVGTIKVNVKENFIKIGEDVSNETLPTGIFI